MKKLLFCLAIFFSAFVINAQTGYMKVANHGSFEKIERVSSGGYITVGFDSVYNIQVVRWNNAFTPMWKYKLTDANVNPVSLSIVEANDGSFYFMTASGEHTGSTLIIKFSSSGSILWQKIYYLTSGNMNSVCLSKAAGSDNGFLFGGGQCTLNNYVIKCDQDGNVVWQKSYYYPLSTGVITCWSIIPDGSNYVISSGYNINSLLTFKTDATGTILSESAYTYTTMQILPTRIVKLNQTGGYAILGNYNSSNNNKTEFVAIYNSSLSLLSFNELTVTYEQFTLEDITAINNGRNIVVNGGIYDASAFTQVIINLSNTGSVVWKKRAQGNTGGINNVEFRGITQNGNYTVNVGHGYNEGSVIAVIDTNGTGLCNDQTFNITNVNPTLTLQSAVINPITTTALSASVNYTYNSTGSFIKSNYCGNLSATENELAEPMLSVYPNPAQDKVFIEYSLGTFASEINLAIFNIEGKSVYQATISKIKGQMAIDIRNFDKGVYMICLKGAAGNTTVKRFIVIR